jgi:hypothetical protein
LSMRAKMQGKGDLRVRKPENSFAKRCTMCAGVSTELVPPSKRLPSGCPKHAALALSCVLLVGVKLRQELEHKPAAIYGTAERTGGINHQGDVLVRSWALSDGKGIVRHRVDLSLGRLAIQPEPADTVRDIAPRGRQYARKAREADRQRHAKQREHVLNDSLRGYGDRECSGKVNEPIDGICAAKREHVGSQK